MDKMTLKGKNLLFVVNEDQYFLSHRLALALAAKAQGMNVAVACANTGFFDEITRNGISPFAIELRRRGLNPIHELKVVVAVIRIIKTFKPDVIHNIALKGILLGCLAAKLSASKAKIFNTFTGLGYVFTSDSIKAKAVKFVLEALFASFLPAPTVHNIFQNSDDLETFRSAKLIDPTRTSLILGSGVDVSKFCPTQEPEHKNVKVIVPARLLREKGIYEVIEAAKILRSESPKIDVHLLGKIDVENPGAISKTSVDAWVSEGLVHWNGPSSNMAAEFENCNIVCLPSYREGVPLALIEAAASGRAIVTTDVPGCREIVRDGVNGYIVPPKNSAALAQSLLVLAKSKDKRSKMAENGRKMVLEGFSNQVILSRQIELYSAACISAEKP